MEEEICQPVSKELLKAELTPERELRTTNKSHNEIYVITASNSPNVMREIGRLREIAFRTAGAEPENRSISTSLTPWTMVAASSSCNPEAEEIIGGYRYLFCDDWKINESGQPQVAMAHMFRFSEKFMTDYAPYTVELGRSFVSVDYQNVRKNTKSIFALDNLWDGLGALTVINPRCKYFLGKMTMYPSFSRRGRDMILYFLHKHFGDKDGLVTLMQPVLLETPEEELREIFCEDDFRKDYRILNRNVRQLGYNIPPLVNAYMNLSPTMKFFGTAINHEFGEVEESGILIAVDEIFEEKRVRHINSFVEEHPEALSIPGRPNTVML